MKNHPINTYIKETPNSIEIGYRNTNLFQVTFQLFMLILLIGALGYFKSTELVPLISFFTVIGVLVWGIYTNLYSKMNIRIQDDKINFESGLLLWRQPKVFDLKMVSEIDIVSNNGHEYNYSARIMFKNKEDFYVGLKCSPSIKIFLKERLSQYIK